MVVVISMTVLLGSLIAVLCGLLVRKNIFDRITLINCFFPLVTLFLVLFSAYFSRWVLIDIALTYAIIGFITSIALYRYLTLNREDIE